VNFWLPGTVGRRGKVDDRQLGRKSKLHGPRRQGSYLLRWRQCAANGSIRPWGSPTRSSREIRRVPRGFGALMVDARAIRHGVPSLSGRFARTGAHGPRPGRGGRVFAVVVDTPLKPWTRRAVTAKGLYKKARPRRNSGRTLTGHRFTVPRAPESPEIACDTHQFDPAKRRPSPRDRDLAKAGHSSDVD